MLQFTLVTLLLILMILVSKKRVIKEEAPVRTWFNNLGDWLHSNTVVKVVMSIYYLSWLIKNAEKFGSFITLA